MAPTGVQDPHALAPAPELRSNPRLMPISLRASALVLPILVVTSCGAPAPVDPEPTPTDTGSESATRQEPAEATSPWAALSDQELVDLVRARAIARIREVAPDLAIDGFQRWRAEPASAPELGDRVCEQLLNLAVADLAAGDAAGAVQTVRLVRARARNRNMAFAGTTLLSVAARAGASDAAAQTSAVAAVFRELPRARFGSSTVIFQIYQERAQIDAALEQTRQQIVSLDAAVSILFFGHVVADVVASRATYLAAIDVVRAEPAARPPDRDYAFGTGDLTGARDAQPVLVAVWDSGTASAPFESQLFTNAAEQPGNGVDDDQNGIVDDVHGVIADPTPGQTGLAFDPGPATITEYAPFLRGVMDLRAGMASTESAQRVLTLMRSATDAASLEHLETNLDAVGEWAHGTHVAGILLAGLPQARLAIFRSAWAGEARLYHHRGPTDAELAAERANVEAIAAFIRAHGVRVVNASLGFSLDYLEAELGRESSVYRTDVEVRRRAETIQAHRAASWRLVFERCPDTLFVVAAGNSNRDVLEYGDVPASIDLPNVVVIGAVDRFGNWATFTNSSRERVRLFDFGVEVDSVIPNGERVPLSGTSMASPNAANLAAKILSVDPTLTPPQVIALMLETADPIAAPFNGAIANERAALERVRRARRRR